MTSSARDETGWTEVLVQAPIGFGELIAEVLAAGSCSSAVIGAADDLPAPQVGLEWVRSALAFAEDSGSTCEAIASALAELGTTTGIPELEGLELQFREIPNEDWAGAWRNSWRPFRVGKLCVVTPDWQGELRPGEKRLALVPGGTFGTGRHATTRACMRLIQERVPSGARVLDVGTGTGILAVTSALFGASQAIGFDIDPAHDPLPASSPTRTACPTPASFATEASRCSGKPTPNSMCSLPTSTPI